MKATCAFVTFDFFMLEKSLFAQAIELEFSIGIRSEKNRNQLRYLCLT